MKKYAILFILLICVCFVACENEKEDTMAQDLSIASREWNFTAAGGTAVYTFSSEIDNAFSNQDWCTCSLSGQVLTLSFTPNYDIEGRSVMIMVTKGDKKINFSVVQPSNIVPTPEVKNVIFDVDQDSRTIKVESVTPYEVVTDPTVNWLTVVHNEKTSEITLTTDNNYTTNTFSTIVKLKSGDLEYPLEVTQKGLVLTPSRSDVVVMTDGGEVTIGVDSSKPFTVTSLDENWMQIVAVDDKSFTLKVAPCEAGQLRNGKITLTSRTLKVDINVTQRTPIFTDYLGSWTLAGPNGRDNNDIVSYNLFITELGDNTYSIKGWGGGSPLSNPSDAAAVPIKAVFNPNTGAIEIYSQPNAGAHVWSGQDCIVCFQGVINRNGGYTIITNTYLAYTGMLNTDGSVKWETGTVILSGVNYKLIGAGYYFKTPDGGYRSYNVDKQLLDPTMTKSNITRSTVKSNIRYITYSGTTVALNKE